MELDRLFWEITGLPENNSLPLSFRAHGTWICTTPAHEELKVADAEMTADAVASEIIRWADTCFSDLSPLVSVSSIIEEIEEMRQSTGLKSYFAAHVCSLILAGRIDAARVECEDAIRRDHAGGFAVARGPTLPEMAIDWIVGRDAR
ncbi:MAG: hypothetical protein DI565_15655 [Ancylobacter novellus]|uniref:Uncharacterized protein n=1 Tax=Ancylobacter novellus TaxID=921 RepID=A0A2W5KBS4_ANCNO|nr:MAG: hypothetical protein DI565_15655 [Ancylobacter novellus]